METVISTSHQRGGTGRDRRTEMESEKEGEIERGRDGERKR